MISKKTYTTFFFFLFFFHFSPLFACDCTAKPELQIKDWNDTPIIFRASLTDYKKTIQFGYFKFSVTETLKGEIPETVTMYFQPRKSHTLLHAVKDFSLDKEWIVFAKKEVLKGKIHYRLIVFYGSKYCGLSRPLQEDEDIYISFLNKMKKSTKGFRKFKNLDNIVIAKGKYRKKCADGEWVYYKKDGRIYLRGEYKEGIKVGLWLKYATDKYQQQIVIQEQYYEEGTLIKKVNFTYFGKLRSEVFYSENSKTLLQYRKEKLISKQIKTLDNKTLSRYKYRDGVLVKEEHF